MVKTPSGRMAKPEDEGGYERSRAGDITLYLAPALAGEDEIEITMPHVGAFVIRRA